MCTVQFRLDEKLGSKTRKLSAYRLAKKYELKTRIYLKKIVGGSAPFRCHCRQVSLS